MIHPASNKLRRRMLLAAALGLLAAGCQGNRHAYRDIYQRELRLQEDEIYRLEDCIKEYQGMIRGYRMEIDQLHNRLQSVGDSGAATTGQPDNDTQRSVLDPPQLERLTPDPPADRARDGLPFRVPDIDLGTPDQAPSRAPTPRPAIDVPPMDVPPVDIPPLDPTPQDAAPGDAGPAVTPPGGIPPIDIPGAGLPPERGREDTYGPIETLPLPTPDDPLGEAPAWDDAPRNASAAPLGDAEIEGYAGAPLDTGEATLVALVRPTAPGGEPARVDAQVSLLLARPDNQQKLAQWDFTPQEIAAAWRVGVARPLLNLEIVLPDGVPMDEPLELWVRITDADGAKVLKRAEVVLNQLASIDHAKLAAATGGVHVASHDGPAEAGGGAAWKVSDRASRVAPAPLVMPNRLESNGWKQTERAAPPRKLEPAAQAAATPLPMPAAPGWSPER